jgi:cell division protein FtsQ
VNDPAGDVLVHLGSADYLRRYKIYVTHAQGWRQQFQKLESVDLRYDNQIIVNPDMERPAAGKVVALSPAAAKTAAAAGVKPAALITRLPVNGRAVPKPAFELTEKKLEPQAAGAKKAVVKAPRKKVVSAGKVSAAKAKGKPGAGKVSVAKASTAKSSVSVKKSSVGGQKPSPAVAKANAGTGD